MDRTPNANERDWFVFLPKHLTDQAIDLTSEGINDRAFPLSVALEALLHLRGQWWVVYGGDFYARTANGRWRSTDENWYVQRQTPEADSAFIERSIDAAMAAISKVEQRVGEDADTVRVVLTAANPRPA